MMEKWTIPGPNISPKLNLLHVLMRPNTYVASNLKNSFTCSFILPFAQLQLEEMESLTKVSSHLAKDLAENLADSQLFSKNLAKSQRILAKNLAKVLAANLAEQR